MAFNKPALRIFSYIQYISYLGGNMNRKLTARCGTKVANLLVGSKRSIYIVPSEPARAI